MAAMTQYEKARRWRQHANLSIDRLAELTGYSREAIYCFERGQSPNTKDGKIRPQVWLRYKNACAGLLHELRTGKKFNW